jgi:hypothetical protein
MKWKPPMTRINWRNSRNWRLKNSGRVHANEIDGLQKSIFTLQMAFDGLQIAFDVLQIAFDA